MVRFFIAMCLVLPLSAGAAEITVGFANQHKNALDIDNGRFTGSLARFFQCPFDRSGLTFKIISLPHARVLLELERGDIDIGMPLVRVDSRDQYANFAKTLFPVEFGLFSKGIIEAGDDVTGLSFVALRATASVDMAQQRGGRVTQVSSWTQALELAQLGRYDGAVIPLAALANVPASSLTGLNQSEFGTLPISFYVSRAIDNGDEILQQLNAAIESCRN